MYKLTHWGIPRTTNCGNGRNRKLCQRDSHRANWTKQIIPNRIAQSRGNRARNRCRQRALPTHGEILNLAKADNNSDQRGIEEILRCRLSRISPPLRPVLNKSPTQPRLLPSTQRKQAAAMPTEEARRFFIFAFHTGTRTGEIFALQWNNIAPPYALIEAKKIRGKVTGTKTDKAREIMLPPVVLGMLRDNPSRFGEAEVFLKENGEAHSHGKWLRRQLAMAHERSGVEQRRENHG